MRESGRMPSMKSLLPEKPLLVYPSLAATIGLEEATMISILDNLTPSTESRGVQGYYWYQLTATTLTESMPFWDALDIERISQRLRNLGIILLKSAPYTQSQTIEFAFNQQSSPSVNPTAPKRQINSGLTSIAANWKPDGETIIALGQLNIPEYFAREQVPEFVRYWRESGERQRSWSSKFIHYVKRQWTFHTAQLSRNNRASPLPRDWQPSNDLLTQIASEGIPAIFTQKILKKFKLYHQHSGTTHINWDMPLFSWVKDAWQKQDTPFIESKQATLMQPSWQPDKHTLDYLNVSYGIDARFIQESIPEFIHKWTEKKAIYSEWGRIFAEHVIEQWRFVQAGINRNPKRQLINKHWYPSADCLEILQAKSGVDRPFIDAQVPEFILYWSNRAEPMHSWDNIFLRHIKNQWAAAHKGNTNERQQAATESTRTKDRTISVLLNDTSWAS